MRGNPLALYPHLHIKTNTKERGMVWSQTTREGRLYKSLIAQQTGIRKGILRRKHIQTKEYPLVNDRYESASDSINAF